MADERLETAALRNFVVSMRSLPGIKPDGRQVIAVQAHSVAMAKELAMKKVCKGAYKNRRKLSCWRFDSVEAVENGPT